MHALASLMGRAGMGQALPPLANLVISNVPGPQSSLYAAGARMSTYWPMSIVEHGLGLNVTVLSYAGQMHFGFTAARNVVTDADAMSALLLEALRELQHSRPRSGRPARTTSGRPPPTRTKRTGSAPST
jgi:hypothetical protein